MTYNLLHIAIRVHEEILSSKPGSPLSDSQLAVSVKARVGKRLAPSEKQIKGARKFLQQLGYPLVYCKSDHRWFYDWKRVEDTPDCLDDLVERMRCMPKMELACLFVLRHGLDALVGTPLWSEATQGLKAKMEETTWWKLDHLRDLFSVRPSSVPVPSPEIFEVLAEATYQGAQLEADFVEQPDDDRTTQVWDPLHLCQDHGHWHVIVLVRSTNTLETFPVAHVRRLHATGQTCALVARGEIRRYITEFFGTVFVREKPLSTV